MTHSFPTRRSSDLLTRLSSDELRLASREIDAGLRQTDLSVPGISCGGCIRKIEEALGKLPGVTRARVNLSTKRVAVDWRETEGPPPLGEALTGLGYDGFLYEAREDAKDPQRSEEHTSELQSLMRSSYADFCLKKHKRYHITTNRTHTSQTQ